MASPLRAAGGMVLGGGGSSFGSPVARCHVRSNHVTHSPTGHSLRTFRWQREVLEALVDEDIPKLLHALDYPPPPGSAAAVPGTAHRALERVGGGGRCGVPYTLDAMGFYDDDAAAFATPLIGAARRGDTLLHLALRNDLTRAFLALAAYAPCAELARPRAGAGALAGDESVPSLPALAAERLARVGLVLARCQANGIHNLEHGLRPLLRREADFGAIRARYGGAIAEEERLRLLKIKERMVEIFHLFHPSQLEHVETIWADHAGREAELAMKLERKYGGRGLELDWAHSPQHHYSSSGVMANE